MQVLRPALTFDSDCPLDDLHFPLLRPAAPWCCWCPGAHPQLAGRQEPVRGPRPSSATLGSGGRCPVAGCYRVLRVGAGGHTELPPEKSTGSPLHPGQRAYRAPQREQPADARLLSQGTLIQHLKEHSLHGNMTSSDIIFFYTTVSVPGDAKWGPHLCVAPSGWPGCGLRRGLSLPSATPCLACQ